MCVCVLVHFHFHEEVVVMTKMYDLSLTRHWYGLVVHMHECRGCLLRGKGGTLRWVYAFIVMCLML